VRLLPAVGPAAESSEDEPDAEDDEEERKELPEGDVEETVVPEEEDDAEDDEQRAAEGARPPVLREVRNADGHEDQRPELLDVPDLGEPEVLEREEDAEDGDDDSENQLPDRNRGAGGASSFMGCLPGGGQAARIPNVRPRAKVGLLFSANGRPAPANGAREAQPARFAV